MQPVHADAEEARRGSLDPLKLESQMTELPNMDIGNWALDLSKRNKCS